MRKLASFKVGRAAAGIAEADIVELDAAVQRWPQPRRLAPTFGRLVHHGTQHPHGQGGFLVVLNQRNKLHQRVDHPAGKHVEGDQRPHRQCPGKHIDGTHRDDADHQELLESLGRSGGERSDASDPEVHAHRTGGFFLPVALLLRLDGERLDRAHPVDRLDQHGLTLALGLVQRLQATAVGHQQTGDDHRDEDRETHCHKSQLGAVEPQHWQEDQQRAGVQQREEHPPGQELADMSACCMCSVTSPAGTRSNKLIGRLARWAKVSRASRISIRFVA